MKCYVRIVSFCRSELNKFLVESYVNFAYILRYGCSWPIGSYLGIMGPAIPMGGEARLIFERELASLVALQVVSSKEEEEGNFLTSFNKPRLEA